MGRICCRELKESVSSASIEEPVIVPASERIPNRSGTGATLIGSSPPAPATISWPRGASPPSSGDMDLLFAAVARISRALHRDFTGANRENGEGKLSLCSLRSLLFKSGPGDFLVWHDQFKTAVLAQATTFG